MAVTSAGILLFRHSAGELEVLLVHPGGPFWKRKDLGAWTIPKGKIDEGEGPIACALRELKEELGAPPALAVDDLIGLGAIRQKGGKVVHAWAAEAEFDPADLCSNTFTMEWPPGSGVEREYPEIDRAEWFSIEGARQKVNPAQVEFLERIVSLTRPG